MIEGALSARALRDDARFRQRCLEPLPAHAAAALHSQMLGIERGEGRVAANAFLGEASKHLVEADVDVAFDEDAIRELAEQAARRCCEAYTVEQAIRLCERMGVKPPQGRNVTKRSALQRLRTDRWWRRQLRALYTRRAENA